MRRAFLAFFIFVLASGAAAERPSGAVRVLFIGNSLTAFTSVPARLAKLATAMGREVVVDAVTANDFSLEDHWRDGRAQARLAERWDFVVLQQGPSSRPESRAQLIDYARRFAGPIRAAGARPVIFTAWPAANRVQDFPEAIRSHRLAAEAVDAVLAPVGEAWVRALSADRRLRLYADGLHASSTGGDLAVLVLWFALFPAGPQEFDDAYLERMSRALGLEPTSRDVLVDAATRAVDEPMALK